MEAQRTVRPDTRLADLAALKDIVDRKWEANQSTLAKSLDQGALSWRRRKDGGFDVKLKPDL